jgi:hypothetical protein
LSSNGSTSLFAATTLCFSLLSLFCHGWLFVEASTLQLFVNAFMGNFTLQSLDGSLNIISLDNNFEGSEV